MNEDAPFITVYYFCHAACGMQFSGDDLQPND
jgi:YHS domain-containing protein